MNVHHPDIHHAGILRDNDGDPDLFLTFYGRPNALYRNEAGDISSKSRPGPAWPRRRPGARGRTGPPARFSSTMLFLL